MAEWFPSRTLTLYLARLFAGRIFAVLAMLVLVLQLLDLLGESGKILAHHGNGESDVWRYVGLRCPQLVQQFLPYSVLLAALFTFFPLNQNSETIAMRAAGLSAHQILAPLLATAVAVAGISFAFNELVVTRTTGALKDWQAVQYGPVPADTGARTNIYATDGRDILHAARATGDRQAPVLTGVSWYARDAVGSITAVIDSPGAHYAAPGWRLDAPVLFDVATTARRVLPPLVVGQGIAPRAVEVSAVDADRMNIVELSHGIAMLRESGRRTSELEGKWWHKISKPLSAVLMPLLAGIAAFGLARSGQLLLRAVAGMALGFAYFVVDNTALAIGNFGGYPPLIAAWAPFALFLLIGETVLIRTEE